MTPWKIRVIGAAILCNALAAVVLAPVGSAAELVCPDSWGLASTELNVDVSNGLIDGIPTQWISSSLNGPDNSQGQYGGKDQRVPVAADPSLLEFRQSFALESYAPQLYQRLSALGRDVVWSSRYEVVEPISARSVQVKGLFYPEVWGHSWQLRYEGISNDTQIRHVLKIEVRGCPIFELRSNASVISGLSEEPIGWDTYFKASGSRFNFKQEDAIRSTWTANIERLRQVKSGSPIMMQRTRNTEAIGADWFLVGLKPGGCIDSYNPNSSPPGDPEYVIVQRTPCKAGLLMPLVRDSGTYCKASPCTLTPVMTNYLSKHGAYPTDWLLIDTIDIAEMPPPPVVEPLKPASKKSITCVKGKQTKKVVAISPRCPAGWKKK